MTEEKARKRLVSFADLATPPEPPGPPAKRASSSTAKPQLERVTYAQLAALSKRPEDFLDAPALPPPAAPVAVTAGSPPLGTPDTGIPIKGTPDTGAPDMGIPVTSPLDDDPVGAKAGIPESASNLPKPPRQIRQAVLARDGHSLGEQAVYEALWANGAAHAADCRIIAIGYRGLSHACRLTVNNCKANIRSLIRKLAIEEVAAHSFTQARTYLVYSGGAIMRRRKAAGLTHYVKTRGVVFVDPETGFDVQNSGSGIPEAASGSNVPEGE